MEERVGGGVLVAVGLLLGAAGAALVVLDLRGEAVEAVAQVVLNSPLYYLHEARALRRWDIRFG